MARMTKPTDHSKCVHCEEKLAPGHRTIISCGGYNVSMCEKCYREWYNFRDKIVTKAFQEFIHELT